MKITIGFARVPAYLTVLLAVVACATAPKVRVDRDAHVDFAGYKTFALLESGEPQKNGTLVAQRVRSGMTAALQSKGLVLSESQPDIRVSYVLNVYERPKQSGMRVGLGAGGGSGHVGGGVGVSIPLGKRTEVAAAMTIDFIDSKRNAQIWTGTYETVVSDLDVKETDADNLIATILSKYPGS